MKRREGMSLIEVMIAIAVLAIIGSMVYTAFTTVARRRQRVEVDLDRHHAIAAALERMARELSMAYVVADSQLNPNQALRVVRTAFVGTDRGRRDRVDFTSFGHQRLYRNAHESDQNEVSYFLTQDPEDSRRRVLARREQNRIDDDPRKGGRVQVLLEDVDGLELEYLEPGTLNWVRAWDSTQAIGNPNRLPLQVKILLHVADPRDPGRDATYGTRAVLPMNIALNHSSYQ